MSINIETIKGVRCYVDKDGVAQLNLEDVARGLGFTTVATSGNVCVRWNRVYGHLVSFEFPPLVGKDGKPIPFKDCTLPEYIPEPIFYLLSMKAENATARVFQHTIAYDVLPSIRRNGTYTLPGAQPRVYPPKATSVGEVAQLLKVLRATMKDNNQPPEIIAQMVKTVCDQFGISLPPNFIRVNPFQQFALIGMFWPGQGQLPTV